MDVLRSREGSESRGGVGTPDEECESPGVDTNTVPAAALGLAAAKVGGHIMGLLKLLCLFVPEGEVIVELGVDASGLVFCWVVALIITDECA